MLTLDCLVSLTVCWRIPRILDGRQAETGGLAASVHRVASCFSMIRRLGAIGQTKFVVSVFTKR
ncbi:MAG: hypothetical protein JO200_13575 [Comamonas sp.]|nr:hypothetical protein [Comamonas sp.]